MSVAIEVLGLSKRYWRGLTPQQARLSEMALGVGRLMWLRLQGKQPPAWNPEDEFWALRDVNLTIREGDVVGLIGHNGAGKSTLLKILTRIVHPTRGSFTVRGRIASLIEVGTGFHPELTGRENIFLSGCILGMSRQEVRQRFDEIVAFSGVEPFLETPVKRYSSGMHVRLGFSVAAHLDPDIMILDEALAVGDAAFQVKCQEKLAAIRQSGRTILLVSHVMPQLVNLCDRVIWLHQGCVHAEGPPAEIVDQYLASVAGKPPAPVV